MRRALMAGVTLAFMAGAVATGVAPAAAATPKAGAKPKAEDSFVAKGPLQIVVSIANQHVTLYSNGSRMAQGPVSTGIPGKPTPMGVFSIIQKDRYHHSNLYSNAPMPFMERITWSGVALHEGPLPGYPASHGCIRMTHEFAQKLWGITKLGVRVIVARNDVTPVEFSHPSLFVPKAKPAEPPVAGDPEKHVELATPVRVAQAATPSENDSAATPLRGTVETGDHADVTATTPAATPSAAQTGATADPSKPAADVADPDKVAPLKSVPKPAAVAQPPKRSGQVAVFVSRKEKRLYVRQAFAPLFDVPIEIEHPEQPLGTHVFTAMEVTNGGAGMRWNLMSIPTEPPRAVSPKLGRKDRGAAPAETFAPQTAAQVLDRIQIPQEARDRIEEILTPGSSLVVSDQGLGGETGEGTDFIVLTR